MESTRPSVRWFIETQSGWFLQNGIPEWFHGVITRMDAEDLLRDKSPGCFLIRVGESRIGYSLSYRTVDRCRHFIIDVLNGQQCNLAGDTRRHNTLQDLVTFHSINPICSYNEVLIEPCGQKSNATVDYHELFKDNANTSDEDRYVPFPVPEQVQCSTGVLESQQECPPLPPRRLHYHGSLSETPQPSFPIIPTGTTGRLYPSLSEVIPSSTPHNSVPAIPTHGHKELGIMGSITPPNQINYLSNVANKCTDQKKQGVLGGPKQFNSSPKPMKACRNLMTKAVSRMNDGQALIAQELHSFENAVTAQMKNIKENFTHMGQTEKQDVNHNFQQNSKTKVSPEEYRKPPPFAPGFAPSCN
ncbi:hypothetical protein GDO86_001135 [Hymenochirus boettgeri]|uniref:SH2 domain-containing protein n=1 Tax=Hymenochirus boettgeri TaxID=247094 RepID=A0A8T2KDN2_9PIPI|nr:hypothetical protein GDO86_001135 [Hymenochirus boettgeri]